LFGVMDKTIGLLQMGFAEEEVSSAIDTFGKSRIKNAKFCPMLPDSSQLLLMIIIFIIENLINAISLPFPDYAAPIWLRVSVLSR
jgi:hypothetical protein